MLQKMRDNAQGTFARVLVGIIIFVLAVFGFGAFNFFAPGEPVAATVNGDEISQNDLLVESERRKQSLLAQLGAGADPSLIDEARLRQFTLETLISRQVLLQTAKDLGLSISDSRLNQDLIDNPNFAGENGFDDDLYRARVRQLGFTPLGFQARIAEDTKIDQLTGGFRDTAMMTDREIRESAELLTQTRDISYLVFKAEAFTDDIIVSDEDVTTFYDDNGFQFLTDESVDVSYVELSLADLMELEDVTEDDVQTRYLANQSEAAGADRRRASHILITTGDERSVEDATARVLALSAELQGGASFAELAKAHSDDEGSAVNGGDLDFADKGTYVPEFETALWNMQEGELSEPVVTAFGVHLIKLVEVQPIEFPTIDELREGLVAAIKRERAQVVFQERLTEMDEIAYEESDTLSGLAEALGGDVMSQSHVTKTDGLGLFEAANLRDALFDGDVLANGFNTRPITVGDSAVVARVSAHHPAEQRELADVAEEIRDRLIRERSMEKASEAAEQAFAQTEQGDSAAAIADAYGLAWEVTERASRNAAELPAEVRQQAFALPPPPSGTNRSVGRARLANGDEAVVSVSAVSLGDYGALTEAERTALRTQLDQLSAQTDYVALIQSLEDRSSIERQF